MWVLLSIYNNIWKFYWLGGVYIPKIGVGSGKTIEYRLVEEFLSSVKYSLSCAESYTANGALTAV